jgi:hypothetical protein
VLFGIGDERVQRAVLDAQEHAVAAGLSYLERHACRTRMGAGGHVIVEGSGFVGAAFGHRTSRAGDPQIHTHVLVANATRRGDGLWGTLDGRQLYAHAKTAGYVHEAVFRRELTDRLEAQWRAAHNGVADIEGVSDTVIDAFSRRRAEIDAQVAEWGCSSAGARQNAALATRARKDYGVTPAELAPEWRQRAEALGLEWRVIAQLLDQPPTQEMRPFEALAAELVSPHGLTARASTFDRRDVVQAIAAQARGGASLHEIESLTDTLLGHQDVVTLAAGASGHVRRSDVIRRADGHTVAALRTRRATRRSSCSPPSNRSSRTCSHAAARTPGSLTTWYCAACCRLGRRWVRTRRRRRSSASAISSHIGTVRPDPDFGVSVTPIVCDSTTRMTLARKSMCSHSRAIASPGRSPAIAIIMMTTAPALAQDWSAAVHLLQHEADLRDATA